jgi:hypothetical protein
MSVISGHDFPRYSHQATFLAIYTLTDVYFTKNGRYVDSGYGAVRKWLNKNINPAE